MHHWEIIEGLLTREFDCKNFGQAVRFINEIAKIAEKHDHHPDILLHSYKKVKVMLYTHSKKAVTDKDYTLAQAIDNLT